MKPCGPRNPACNSVGKEDELMKKKLTALFASLLCVALLAACGGGSNAPSSGGGTDSGEPAAPAASSGANLKFTTGGDQGTYYAFGSVLAGQVTNSTATAVTAITSGGSKANIQALADNDAQLGFVQSDVMAYGYNGTRLFDAPETGFSTVAALYMEQVQIVTLNPDIKSVADLAGRTVSVGDAGSGVNFNAIDILSVYGIDVEKDINPVYESFGTSAESLQDNKIDAAFVVAGAPTTAVTTLSATKDVYLVGLDDAHIAQLQELSPYYTKTVITADTYNMPEDVTTVAVGAVVIARDDVSEDDVYNFVSTVFENKDEITASHAKGAELDLDFAASVTSVPYHPGAARYFTEKGLSVAVK